MNGTTTVMVLLSNHDCAVLKVYVGYERYEVGCVRYEYTPDYCSHVLCLNNATCRNTHDGYHCVCTPEFYGDLCQWGTHADDYDYNKIHVQTNTESVQ